MTLRFSTSTRSRLDERPWKVERWPQYVTGARRAFGAGLATSNRNQRQIERLTPVALRVENPGLSPHGFSPLHAPPPVCVQRKRSLRFVLRTCTIPLPSATPPKTQTVPRSSLGFLLFAIAPWPFRTRSLTS